MLQVALRTKFSQLPRSQVSETRTLVAPVKGWYVGSPIAAAPPQTAFLLENAFPEIDHVRVRGGGAVHATGMPNDVVTALMAWRGGPSASKKMFASCNGKIFDVTDPGAVGAALVAGLSATATFSYIQFAASGVQTLMAANGVDPVQLYNGTSWGTAPAITGLTGNPLNYLWAYKSNVWGLQPGSLDAWYLPGSAIGGPISKYPMAPLFPRGGSLISGGSWSVHTTAGPKYFIIFLTDQGEATIFEGDTPALPEWNRLGTYQISPPVGPKCLLQAGGDLAVMTQDGIIPVSAVQTTDQVALQNQAVTVYIQPAWRDAVIARAGLQGWQIINWAIKSMAIVVLPQKDSADKTLFVANGRTGAWCRYTGWDVRSMEAGGLLLDKLFYGTSDGRVMQAESGGQDDGKAYTSTIFHSFADLGQAGDSGSSSVRKQIRMARPRLKLNRNISLKLTVRTDFDTSIPLAPGAGAGPFPGVVWGTAKWGVDTWPQISVSRQVWLPAPAIGSVLAPVVQMSLKDIATPDIALTSTDLLFEQGSIFG